MKSILIILATFLLMSCGTRQDVNNPSSIGPQIISKKAGDILYESDVCALTGEVITVVRYGAVLEFTSGERLKFNAAESMARYMLLNNIRLSDISALLVVDFADGEKLIPVTQATYLQSSLRPSPGKMFITPINRNNNRMIENIYRAYPGNFIEWDDLVEITRASAMK